MPALGIGNVQAVIGRSTAVEIAQGTPLQTSSLLDGLAGLLQSGERAVAIKVEEFSSVGHKVKPGDWVDVFAVLRKDATEVEDTQARLLLPRKRVLAFGAQLHPAAQSTQEKKDEDPQRRGTEVAARTAVIAVHVEEVNRLILAEQQGQVLLALRSPLDQVQPSAEIWQQTMGVVQAPEIAGAATGGASAMDASLTALTLSALTGVPEAKATATARSVASQPRVGAQRTQTRRNTVPVSGTSVEVVRGTRSETVRY
jgi:pilus assembly protein CpaB